MNVSASSSSDGLSSNQNDGNVKKTVTTAETANGKIRNPNNRLAFFTAVACLVCFAPHQANETSKESGQYTVAKNARETRRLRAANIIPDLLS
jgi:hypothetical protein